MIRKGIIQDVKTVLALIKDSALGRAIFFEESVSVSGVRLETFAIKGTKCVFCGAEASFFAVEKHHVNDGSYHLNLYGYNQHGKELLFTRDHILAKSKGGPNTLDNMQPACVKCNGNKGDKDSYDPSTYITPTPKKKRKKKPFRYLGGDQTASQNI